MAWTLSYVHDHGHYVSDPGSLIDPMNNRIVNHVWVTVEPSWLKYPSLHNYRTKVLDPSLGISNPESILTLNRPEGE